MVELQRDSVQPPPIFLGTITQMEAFMKHWWEQSAFYNAQPSVHTTTFPANQKRAVAERRAVAKAATNLPSPFSHRSSFPFIIGRGRMAEGSPTTSVLEPMQEYAPP